MKRHLAIGDIHGCFNALRTLAEFVELRPDDTSITLGDYVNRGPDTCAVLDWLIDKHTCGQLIPLRGNHEIMMLDAQKNARSFEIWIDVGGDATLNSYSSESATGLITDIPKHHWSFLKNDLRATFQTDRHFFVHANAYADIPINDQPESMLYWEQFNQPPRHESGKIMVCGHTSQRSGLPITNGNAICIDTWACGGGWLTCLHVESGMIWQANEAGETRHMHLDDL